MRKGVWLCLFLAFLCLSAYSFARVEFIPPEGLTDDIEEVIQEGFDFSTRVDAWNDKYDAPRTEYSSHTHFDAISLEVLGKYLRGAVALRERNLLDGNVDGKIDAVAKEIIDWQFVPEGTDWGLENEERSTTGEIVYVHEKINGISGAKYECGNEDIIFNVWSFPLGSENYNRKIDAGSMLAPPTGLLSLYESDFSSQYKSNYIEAGKKSAESLLTMVVVPETEDDFGLKKSLLESPLGAKMSIGMIPGESIYYAEEDEPGCSNRGAEVFYFKIYKHKWAAAALVFEQMYSITKDEKYKRAADYVMEGLMVLGDCDGMYKSYTTYLNPGAERDIKCRMTDGDDWFKYEDNVVTYQFQEVTYDTMLVLYQLHESTNKLYSDSNDFRYVMNWMLELEEEDQGFGHSMEKYATRQSTDKIDITRKPFSKAVLSAMFFRSACQIKDDPDLRDRFVLQGKKLAEGAIESAKEDDVDKPMYLMDTDIGWHMLGLKALSEVHEIFTVGCSIAPDLDSDGYYDDPAEGDMMDCDDSNSDIYPGAVESCDGVDNDCDGTIDEGFDEDGDGVTSCAGDCNDLNEFIAPGKREIPNRVDDDCDGFIDEKSITIDTKDENGVGYNLVPVGVFLWSKNIDSDICASKYAEEKIEKIWENCEPDFNCMTNAIGVCSLDLPDHDIIVIAKINDANYLGKRLASNQGDDLFTLQREIAEDNSDDVVADETNAQPNANFPITMDFVFIAAGLLGIVLIVIALGVVLLVNYLIRIKKRPPKLSGPPKDLRELGEYYGQWTYKGTEK